MADLLRLCDKTLLSGIRSLCRWRSYPFFPWIVIWEVTRRCNLNCWYCFSHPDNKAIENYEKALESLIRLSPRGIYCFGGEPLMCKCLPETLSEIIRNRPNTYISMSTNGLFPDRLIRCLPYLKQILYSIDGIDESNRLNRGCNGEILFNNLKALCELIRKDKLPVSVVTHTVITRHNYRHLPELVAEVKNINPEMCMIFFTLIPHSHPLSVRSDEKTRREFEEIFDSLKGRYSKIKINTEVRHGIRINCYRQYFMFFMDPNGFVKTCKPYAHLEMAQRRLESRGDQLSPVERMRIYAHLMDVLLLRKSAPGCECSCDWHLSLDSYLMGEEMMDEGLFPVLRGNISGQEADRAYRFIRRHISKNFPEEWLTRFIDEARQK